MKRSLYSISDYLHNYLVDRGIEFNEYGYPLIPEEYFLKEEPEEILPYQHRNSSKNPAKTVLCYFANDECLYPRLDKLEEGNEKLKGYMGVSGFDLSPRRGYAAALQEFNLLLNRMVDAYHAVNGIKLMPNFRTGDIGTIDSLSAYPPQTLYVAGSLGCCRRYLSESNALLRAKLLYARPKKLLIYGPLMEVYRKTLEEFGQDYRCFQDFQSASRLGRR